MFFYETYKLKVEHKFIKHQKFAQKCESYQAKWYLANMF